MHRHIHQASLAPACTQNVTHPRWLKTPARLWRWPRRRPRPTDDISAFSIRSAEKLSFDDIDRNGHICNSVFAVCWQHARSELLCNASRVPLPEGLRFAMISLQLDFLGEMHWPATIEIGTHIDRVDRVSVTIGQGLFLGVRCAARARSVVGLMDRAMRQATALPAPLIGALRDIGQREFASADARVRRAITGMQARA